MWEQMTISWDHLIDKLIGWFDTLVVNLPNLILSIIVMAIAYLLSRYIQRYLSKLLKRITDNPTLAGLGANIVTFGFLMLALFIVLGILNLDKALNSLLATAGVAGLAVGLALQDPLVNLFSGVLMSIKKYYKEGDLIKTNGYLGRITNITLRNTVILQPDGQEVIMPNKTVVQNPLVNYSHNGFRRVELSCGVSYHDDLDFVKELVETKVRANLNVLEDRPVEVFFYEFGDSSINFKLRFWQNATQQGDYFKAQDQAIRLIKRTFDEEGISIPFPIRTLEITNQEQDQLVNLMHQN